MPRHVDVNLWMRRMRKLPRGLDRWVYDTVLPARYIMVALDEHGKRTVTCKHCGWTGPTKLKVNVDAACPACKTKAITKSAMRNGNMAHSDYASIVQRIQGGVVVRTLWCRIDYSLTPARPVYGEIRRTIFSDDERTPMKFGHSWSQGRETDGWEYSPHSSDDHENHIHPSVGKALKGTRWKWSGLPEAMSRGVRLPAALYLRAYLRYPAIEMLAKVGFDAMLRDAVWAGRASQPVSTRLSSNDPEVVVGVPRRYWPIVKALNMGSETVVDLRKIVDQGHAPTLKDAELMMEGSGGYYSDRNWVYLLFHRFPELDYRVTMDYLAGQERSARTDYRDYLDMIRKLGLDMKDSDVLRPKHLKAEHDRLAKVLRGIADKERAEKYRRAIEKNKALMPKMETVRDGLLTRVPKTEAELVQEGSKLNHCVASYAERVAKGECVIVFVRQEAHPDTPFVTVEVKDGRVAQARGVNNAAPTKEVERFLKAWSKDWQQAETAGRRA